MNSLLLLTCAAAGLAWFAIDAIFTENLGESWGATLANALSVLARAALLYALLVQR